MKKSNKRTPKAKVANTLPVVTGEAKPVKNDLATALLAPSGSGFFNYGNTYFGSQLSQVDTLFKNNRWYLISNMRQLLNEMYVEHGLVQTVVNVPVDDAFRGGIDIRTKQLSPEQVEQLQKIMDREGDLKVASMACKWNRLFGGAGILVLTDQDPMTPLNIKSIRKDSKLKFKSADMWELFWDTANNAGFDGPAYETNDSDYSYYGIRVHPSRVRKLVGLEAPSFVRPRLRGWGFSIIEALVRSINQYLKSTDLAFEVLDEFKVDVFGIQGLSAAAITEDGTAQIQRRVAIANQEKNYNNAITMDSEDTYTQKELSFTGLAEVQAGIRMQVASDLRMPLTKIFGISAQGFNSGQDDIENYNAMVMSTVREPVKYDLMFMVELRCQKEFGYVPDDLDIAFRPLRVLSAEQEENCKSQQFTRVLSAKQAGEISSLEFRQACNKSDLLPIQLETTQSALDLVDEENEADQANDASDEGGEPKKAAGKKSTLKAPEAKS